MPPPTDPRSDQELVAALNAGDLSSFDALYWRYRDRVVRLALRFTHHEADALDVVQETFAYLLRKFPGFVLTASMTTFLYPVVRNLSLEARRKRTRALGATESADELPIAAAPDPSACADSDLPDVIANLPDAQRQAVLLRFVDGLTVDETAAATGVPAGTVKSRLHHAIAALRTDPRLVRYFRDSMG